MNNDTTAQLTSKPRVVVVMPAYNVAGVIAKTIAALPTGCIDKVIVIDDGSRDGTADVAVRAGATTISHPVNRGYGGAQKTGFEAAIECGAEIVVLVHGDNQYDPSCAERFVEMIRDDGFDVVTGTRMVLGDALKKQMPIWKYIPIRATTWLQNRLIGTQLSDYHDGYRAYRVSFLRCVPLARLSDRFDFDTDVMIQAVVHNMRIGEVPHPTRYGEENSQLPFFKAVSCQLTILCTAFKFLLHRIGLRRQSVFEQNPSARGGL
ncbi:MAG: glycosyltransferase family 2 protein [Verrucomicrobiota bacterium]